ncbi:MAG: FAD-dependent oxidoreductase [Oscillospiraceae bacterium]|nr:FAD-dependent oxidoreductase [Oscillospiraceae bacterium]
MPIIVSEIKLSPDDPKELAFEKALSMLKIKSSDVKDVSISKISVDARKKNDVKLVCSVAVSCENEEKIAAKTKGKNVVFRKIDPADIPVLKKVPECRPVIIGFGPAGMFAGLYLARAGAKPIIFERGAKVEERTAAVENYWNGGVLNERANVQFGEGGAGTFSDGKLTTRINDPRCDFIIKEFEKHGAPAEILSKAKPHIGTDMLRKVVKNIREEIISLGGEIRFLSKVDDISIKNGKIVSVSAEGIEIPAKNVIIAAGHSARDTFAMLKEKGVLMEAKPFSVGVRIEHLQSDINRAQYGDFAGHPALWAAEYQLSHHVGDRCAYTFCMCPGGYVVPSADREDAVVTNGMSCFARDGKNANSALVCSVSAEDFGGDPFKAMAFQHEIERKAFELGGGTKAPAQTVGAFLNGGVSRFGKVEPSYARGVVDENLSELFPEEVTSVLKTGLLALDRKLHGFADPKAVLTGPETRTSSPVRIVRNSETLEAVGIEGLYPCAEGAGYAGGIMSAAADGIRCAEKVLEKLM